MSRARGLTLRRAWTGAVPERVPLLVAEHGLPLLVFSLIAILFTWPLALRLGAAMPSEPGEGAQDLWEKLWNIWWFGQALRRGVNPFHTDMIFYPTGASLLFHPLNPTSALMALPVRAVAGPIVAYNTVVLLSYVLSGYAIFILARRHGCGRAAALIGGLVFTASTFHFYHMRLSHLELIPIQWLPLYALALDLLFERPSAPRIMAATLAFLLIVFTGLYLALYAALLTALWALWEAGRRGWKPSRIVRPALALGAMTLLASAVIAPILLVPMAREAGRSSYMVQNIATSGERAAAPLDALLPPPAHPLRGILPLPAPKNASVFLGFVPLALALYGAIARRRPAARWLVLAIVAWLLSLGPALPLYRALFSISALQVSRYPDRFIVLTLLGVAMLAAFGASRLTERMHGRAAVAAGSGLFALVLAELWGGPLVLTTPFDNPFYQQLARDREAGTVLELPIDRVNSAWLDMYAQTIHGHPIPNGTLARRVPRIPYEWMPMVRQWQNARLPDDIIVQTPEARAAALRFFDLRRLIVHRQAGSGPVTPPTADELARISGVPVKEMYSDDELVAFRLDPPPGPASLPPLLRLREGWHKLEDPGPNGHRWIDQKGAHVEVYAPATGQAALRLKLMAYHQPQRLEILLDDRPIGQVQVETWQAEIVTPPFPIAKGQHTLRLVPAGSGISPRSIGDGGDDRVLTVGMWAIEMEGR